MLFVIVHWQNCDARDNLILKASNKPEASGKHISWSLLAFDESRPNTLYLKESILSYLVSYRAGAYFVGYRALFRDWGSCRRIYCRL